eukprot:Pgem_evm1s18395
MTTYDDSVEREKYIREYLKPFFISDIYDYINKNKNKIDEDLITQVVGDNITKYFLVVSEKPKLIEYID